MRKVMCNDVGQFCQLVNDISLFMMAKTGERTHKNSWSVCLILAPSALLWIMMGQPALTIGQLGRRCLLGQENLIQNGC